MATGDELLKEMRRQTKCLRVITSILCVIGVAVSYPLIRLAIGPLDFSETAIARGYILVWVVIAAMLMVVYAVGEASREP
jgi:hypothetical protein